ncbi:hypothetical protein [Gloeobacter violaceus]|uniref:hypothetical protein n=1 Tax=Gloeobacter violaceus TaxID=33072 RepID=UPI0013E8CD77|nr:hypothetical protein [Gloeobacter violaceus]
MNLVGVFGALQLLADVGGLIPGLNVPSALLGIGVAAALTRRGRWLLAWLWCRSGASPKLE